MIPLKPLPLDAQEIALLDILDASDPALAQAVRRFLPTARQGIMERLVLAVLRAGKPTCSEKRRKPGTRWTGSTANWQRSRRSASFSPPSCFIRHER